MSATQLLNRLEEGEEAFLGYLGLARNMSPNTVRAYGVDLRAFRHWLLATLHPSPQSPQADAAELRELPDRFLSSLGARKMARTSIARKASALKCFFRFLMKEGYSEARSLPLNFQKPKLQKCLPDFLSVQEVDQLLGTLKKMPPSPLQKRNLAVVELLFSSGIRVSELVGLNAGDVNWDQGELRVMGKGGRERISFMSRQAKAALKAYQACWPQLSKKGDSPTAQSPLFLNAHGQRLTVRSVHRFVALLGREARLGKATHPHIFRHSFATHLLNRGVDLRIVQELLGHVSIRSTQIYTHITTERLRRAYLAAHPRAKAV